jgi:23S rRNA pseudouridine1911/1915/1917 synthase
MTKKLPTSPEIVYEDPDVLVLDKPAGLVVHGDGRTVEPSLCDWILENYPELKDVGEPFVPFAIPSKQDPNPVTPTPIPRPGIVHRLDRDTSGLIVIAKTQMSFDYLKEQFKDQLVKKEYIALVYGHLETEGGKIDVPIGKSKSDFRQREAGPNSGGTQRDAVTLWELKERLIDKDGHKFSLLYVRPQTGRTHQIRAHMKSIGHPVTCDSLYAHGRLCPPPLERHSLHAAKLGLTLPSGAHHIFIVPLPDDFTQALEQLQSI